MDKSEGTKELIVDSAWELFHEKGYDNTTINDIVKAAGISKGAFYYYFDSKDILLNTLSTVLDRKYIELEEQMKEEGIENSFDQLIYLNKEMHTYMGENINYELLGKLYSAQIQKTEGLSLIDQNRYYFQLLRKIIEQGQKKNEITREYMVSEIVKMYGLVERALVTDWCMCNGRYSLGEMSAEWMPVLFGKFKA